MAKVGAGHYCGIVNSLRALVGTLSGSVALTELFALPAFQHPTTAVPVSEPYGENRPRTIDFIYIQSQNVNAHQYSFGIAEED